MKKWMVVLLGLMLVGGCGGGKEVPVVQVRKGTISESFTEPARTRLEVRHRIAMPVTGDVARIELKPGDRVTKGEPLFRIDLVPFETVAREAAATVAQLESQLALLKDDSVEEGELAYALAQAEAADAGATGEEFRQEDLRLREERLAKELARLEGLSSDSGVAEREIDDARMEASAASVAVQQGKAMLVRLRSTVVAARAQADIIRRRLARETIEEQAMAQQIERARAALDRARHDLELARVLSPLDGIVLERFEIGGGPLEAGTPVMLVGTLEELEVEADVLTQDAYRLQVGAPVEYTVSTGAEPLRGKVTRIDPAGFTKFSSLGVEQQRVVVISSLEERPALLGLGFRVLARYSKGSKDAALIIPRSAVLEDPDGTRYVFRSVGGRAERAVIELGLRGDFEVEIIEGLKEGDTVVLSPDSTTKPGKKL
jgi:HlyD family secretion protein